MSESATYNEWISKNIQGNGYGKCKETCEAMVAAFPELTMVRGHYYCLIWGERAHWWCKTPDGKIVDPTVAQFPSKGGPYEEWNEGDEEPTGLCPNCGEHIYGGGSLCSTRCEREYMAYLKTGIL